MAIGLYYLARVKKYCLLMKTPCSFMLYWSP